MQFSRIVCAALMALCLAAGSAAAEPGKVVFCKTFTDEWVPVGAADTFDTNVVSWIAYARKAYGAPQIMFSIYRKEKDNSESLVYRENMDVRPVWNATGAREMPFPGEGTYTLAFDTLAGEPISSGVVTITGNKVVKKIPKKLKPEGTTLADLFNKYKPKP